MFDIGPSELIIIFGIIVLLFGASRIPQVARALGRSIGEFKRGMREDPDETVKAEARAAEKSEKS